MDYYNKNWGEGTLDEEENDGDDDSEKVNNNLKYISDSSSSSSSKKKKKKRILLKIYKNIKNNKRYGYYSYALLDEINW